VQRPVDIRRRYISLVRERRQRRPRQSGGMHHGSIRRLRCWTDAVNGLGCTTDRQRARSARLQRAVRRQFVAAENGQMRLPPSIFLLLMICNSTGSKKFIKKNKKIKNKEKTSVKYIALPASLPSGLKNN